MRHTLINRYAVPTGPSPQVNAYLPQETLPTRLIITKQAQSSAQSRLGASAVSEQRLRPGTSDFRDPIITATVRQQGNNVARLLPYEYQLGSGKGYPPGRANLSKSTKYMKKLFLSLLLVGITGLAAQAQFAVGVKGGLSSSGVDVKNARNTLTQLKDVNNITGYHLGAFTRVKVANFFIQPEAYFATSGGRLQEQDVQNNSVNEIKARFNRFDVPVMAGLTFLKFGRIQAGPVASVLMGSRLDGQKIKDYLGKTDWGYQIGAGVDISNLTLDVRYENIRREYTNQNTSFDLSNQQVILSLGIKLIGK